MLPAGAPAGYRKLLESIIGANTPQLPGALCRNLPEQFDPWLPGEDYQERRERLALDVHACRLCPCLRECRAWRDSLPADQQPIGVCGGVLRRSYGSRDH
jgi:hypothetical protein